MALLQGSRGDGHGLLFVGVHHGSPHVCPGSSWFAAVCCVSPTVCDGSLMRFTTDSPTRFMVHGLPMPFVDMVHGLPMRFTIFQHSSWFADMVHDLPAQFMVCRHGLWFVKFCQGLRFTVISGSLCFTVVCSLPQFTRVRQGLPRFAQI